MSSTATLRIEQDADIGGLAGDPYAEFTALMTPELMLRLRKMVGKYAHSCIETDDLLQDAVERALRNWDSFQTGTNLMAWLRTIVQRMAIDQWRRRRGVNRSTVSVDDIIDPSHEEEPQPTWSEYSVEDVRRAMARLTEPLRLAYQMHTLDGMSYQAIASQLGIALATVGTRLNRARCRLRQLLEQSSRAKVVAIRGTGSDLPVRSSGKDPARWYRPRPLPQKQPPAPRRRRGDLSVAWPAATAASC